MACAVNSADACVTAAAPTRRITACSCMSPNFAAWVAATASPTTDTEHVSASCDGPSAAIVRCSLATVPNRTRASSTVDSIGSRDIEPGDVEDAANRVCGCGEHQPRAHGGEPVLQVEQHPQPYCRQQRHVRHLHDRVAVRGSVQALAELRDGRRSTSPETVTSVAAGVGTMSTMRSVTAHLSRHASEMAALRDRRQLYVWFPRRRQPPVCDPGVVGGNPSPSSPVASRL